MLFAVFFDKSKLLLYLLIVLFFYLYMFYPHLIALQGGSNSFWYIYPITLSLGFVFLSILEERGLLNRSGLFKVIFGVILLLISYYLLKKFDVTLKTSLSEEIFWFALPRYFEINQIALLLLLLSVV